MSQYLSECRYATKLRSPVKQSRTDPKLLDLLWQFSPTFEAGSLCKYVLRQDGLLH